MIYLFLSIVCSVTVGVLLKLAKRYSIHLLQAITWNYLFAIGLCYIFFKPEWSLIGVQTLSPVYITLGLLLPSIFIFLGLSVKNAGLARTDIAQRLSLFISLGAAYFLFNEQFDPFKQWGVAVGLIAILCTLYRKTESQRQSGQAFYLLLVFAGFGTIDVLFKKLSQMALLPYTTSLVVVFALAFLLSLSYLLFLVFRRQTRLSVIHFVCGCILGLFNFGNILFYVKAHQQLSEQPSVVFAAMNMGVIILGSLTGIFIFKEKLSKINYLGLGMALLAIILITLSKIYAV